MTTEALIMFVLLTLACYRVSLMIAEDVGPWRIFESFREGFPSGWQYDGVCCIGCVGVWVSAVATALLTVLGMIEYPVLIWLACSGGICFLNRIAPCRT
jgi:hypothetical protein